jgi:hypothetical protein
LGKLAERYCVNHELFENVRWLIGAIARGLSGRSGEGVSEVLERLAEQGLTANDFREVEPKSLPVVRHLPDTIGECLLVDADLAAALAAVEDSLHWRQSEAYSDALLGEGFMANYGWSEIIGPRGFFPGDDFLLGLLMLGPGHHYRDHFHPAPELYWPLTAGSTWSRDSGPFVEKPPGATGWHPSMAMHATQTGASPLLTVWSWTRDTGTPARLAGC